MVKRYSIWITIFLVLVSVSDVSAEQPGSIRGMVFDKDFDAPLAAAEVTIAETGQKVTTSDGGNYVFTQVEPDNYTLVFSKNGYVRQVKSNVVVSPGKMTEVDSELAGDFTEMEEFVVQDVQIGVATESALLELRMESPSMMDSISTEMMSQAGAGDAAAALRLVSGATVQDGKYATVRGLPDRYVNSQMNGVRLPTADADKRAVQLDQFPSAVISSVQVSKTFTPDQQGDASGGAVNVVLKGVPDETAFSISGQTSWNTNVGDARKNFLTYKNGGVNTWAKQDRAIPVDLSGFDPILGMSYGDAPTNYKWGVSGGGKRDFDDFRIGVFGSFFYDRSSSYSTGIDDRYWVVDPGGAMVPQSSQGSPDPAWNPEDPYNPAQSAEFYTNLFDVKSASQNVQWGGLGVLGLESENHSINVLHMYTRDATDKVTLAENTRGKEYYFPGYERDNPTHPGNTQNGRNSSPYMRLETLEYTERTTKTTQFSGRHTLPDLNVNYGKLFSFLEPVFDWTISSNQATLLQPDKRLFGSEWYAEGQHSQFDFISYDEGFAKFRPATNVNLGSIQRIWKKISENSNQYSLNLKLPFEQWSGDEGYFKIGVFDDRVNRTYNQDTFSNPNDGAGNYIAPWENYWSEVYPKLADKASNVDIDYKGRQDLSAWYYMMDVPFNSQFKVIGGARVENTDLSIRNFPDTTSSGIPVATWFDPDSDDAPRVVDIGKVYPDGPDVIFSQRDVLPSIALEYNPFETITLRGSYSETVARQTFKELSPIVQQEYLGGPVFIGNPNLRTSSLKNYDLRLDYRPTDTSMLSASYFYKNIKDPIEYVQGNAGFTYTYPVNYPKGKMSGLEFELRQQMNQFHEGLTGLTLGANATFMKSEVKLREEEITKLQVVDVFETKRNMTNAPKHLYNIYLTYELEDFGTQFGLFYTVRGDTLVAGGSQTKSKYIPNIYETEYGTLNFNLSQKLGEVWRLRFQAKNLLNPNIETVYRYNGSDTTKTSHQKGREFSISLSAKF